MNLVLDDTAADEWVSVADIMAALMIVFLFIAIVYIKPLADQQAEVREIAIAWQASERAIHEALVDEFQYDLEHWDAEIEASTLLVRFRSPDILFDAGNEALKLRFKHILDDFFPRYVARLSVFSDDIEEIRIEGHSQVCDGFLQACQYPCLPSIALVYEAGAC
jgi:outer membrane protein OmpA-like peptidoglycan-associated protein